MSYKKIKPMVAIMVATVLIGGNNHNLLASEEVYYTNDNGLSLTYNEYVKLNEIVSDSFIDYLTEDEYEYILYNVTEEEVQIETVIVETVETVDLKGNVVSVDTYITEDEYLDKINMTNVALCSLDTWEDSVQTEMKKLTLEFTSVGGSTKTALLKCEWLSLPKCRSFDVIGMRVTDKSLTIDIAGITSNILGKQIYDGKTIKYTSNSDNMKYLKNGLGLSMNIVDDVSSSLKCEFSVTFGTAAKDFDVYGSYQHAVKNVSLWTSKQYSMSSSGMGGVFKFSNIFAKDVYDKTPGLHICGDIDDYLD